MGTVYSCTGVIKGTNGKVISYELQDSTGKTFRFSSEKLKILLSTNKIQITNLSLQNNEIGENPDYAKNNFIAKMVLFGIPCKSACGHTYYMTKNSEVSSIYIPDDVVDLLGNQYITPEYCKIECNTLKIVGGRGLKTGFAMFRECRAKYLDLSMLDTSNITDMTWMFALCTSKIIDFSKFDTSNVENMCKMFTHSVINRVDLSSFNTSKVTNMNSMFWCSSIKYLNVRTFDTSNVRNMGLMFAACSTDELDLSSFNTSNVLDMHSFLLACKAKIIATDKNILEQMPAVI